MIISREEREGDAACFPALLFVRSLWGHVGRVFSSSAVDSAGAASRLSVLLEDASNLTQLGLLRGWGVVVHITGGVRRRQGAAEWA